MATVFDRPLSLLEFPEDHRWTSVTRRSSLDSFELFHDVKSLHGKIWIWFWFWKHLREQMFAICVSIKSGLGC